MGIRRWSVKDEGHARPKYLGKHCVLRHPLAALEVEGEVGEGAAGGGAMQDLCVYTYTYICVIVSNTRFIRYGVLYEYAV